MRVISGAVALWLIVCLRGRARVRAGSWLSAPALFAYAAAFSYAYVTLPAGTGALLLFGAVQATMTIAGLTQASDSACGRVAGSWSRWRGWSPCFFPASRRRPLAVHH